ncbi:guanine nucleotide binding protein, alpha subunit [Schizophyllum amplum]|uniref:Guanine nucleotide binding protein, alpha subunit n=1 Tax=Schizophyllum amplum TaxID=97359 RepID=A0A550BY90_9AGAR|nr:guanine nucleotide binding protein, alpha subunit [Auriculariopsis ampla]
MPGVRRNTNAIWPPPTVPPDETESDRLVRIQQEEEAKRTSEAIDQQLRTEREARKKSSVKILLLGQAESGKSTMLKNFQLHFAPNAFDAESDAWRPIIHLNLVRHVNFAVGIVSSDESLRPSSSGSKESSSGIDDVRRLCMKLSPLKRVEESWTRHISGSNAHHEAPPTEDVTPNSLAPPRAPEVYVRSGQGWRGLMRFRRQSESAPRPPEVVEDEQNRHILAACASDIVAFWEHPTVQRIIDERRLALREQPGFFLDDVARIAAAGYKPTPDDIVRARVHTVGPEEHHIVLETAFENGKIWTIYDVGGSRSQRAVWAQYFDDVHVVTFMAPISAFDQFLVEDSSVNRLADTLELWRQLCSNRLLENVEFILFLNKLDILESKIKADVKFVDFVTSYRQRPNEAKHIAKYLLEVFKGLHVQHSPKKRVVHPHLICAIDTRATAAVITQIQEVILLKALSSTNII